MKKITSAMLLLVASAAATALEPVAGEPQSMVMTHGTYRETAVTTPQESEISGALAEHVLAITLDVVSASLSYDIEQKIIGHTIATDY